MRSTRKKYVYRYSRYGEMRDRIEAMEKEGEKEKNTPRAAARFISIERK